MKEVIVNNFSNVLDRGVTSEEAIALRSMLYKILLFSIFKIDI